MVSIINFYKPCTVLDILNDIRVNRLEFRHNSSIGSLDSIFNIRYSYKGAHNINFQSVRSNRLIEKEKRNNQNWSGESCINEERIQYPLDVVCNGHIERERGMKVIDEDR